MNKCPVCETEVNEKYDYCPNCAWEFEYYFDELSEEERERYETRLSIWKSKFNGNSKNFHKKHGIFMAIFWAIVIVGVFILSVFSFQQYDITFLPFEYSDDESGGLVGITLALLIFFKKYKKMYGFEKFLHWLSISFITIVLLGAIFDEIDGFSSSFGLGIGIILSLIFAFVLIKTGGKK